MSAWPRPRWPATWSPAPITLSGWSAWWLLACQHSPADRVGPPRPATQLHTSTCSLTNPTSCPLPFPFAESAQALLPRPARPFAGGAQFDVVQDFARPLPALVIADILGLP